MALFPQLAPADDSLLGVELLGFGDGLPIAFDFVLDIPAAEVNH